MEKSQKSQIIMLSLIVLLLFTAPLLSSSLRPHYLYVILNLLIVALGAEAGLLSFLKPQDEKTPSAAVFSSNSASISEREITADEISPKKLVKKVEKCVSERVVSVAKVHKLKKSPSTPSIFFIGSGDECDFVEEEEAEEGCLSGPELFNKAETFIGNFYNQLKIQREDSWRRITSS